MSIRKDSYYEWISLRLKLKRINDEPLSKNAGREIYMRGKLYGVGVGPGDPELLTLKAVKTITAADVIACPAKGNEPGLAFQIAEKAIPEIRNKAILPLGFPMMKRVPKPEHLKAAESIISQLDAGKNTAFLTLGDPGFYSTFYYVFRIIAGKGYQAEIISGVPSFCAVSARLMLPLAEGDGSVLISSGELADFRGTQVIMKAGSRLKSLKEKIYTKGKTAYLTENCGMDDERSYSGIDTMPDEAGYFSTLIVK